MSGRPPSPIIPSLRSGDAPGAIEFLYEGFGCACHAISEGAREGTIAHAQLTLGGGLITLGGACSDAFGARRTLDEES